MNYIEVSDNNWINGLINYVWT